MGAGLMLDFPPVRIMPGLRFTRYGESESWLPGTNSVDFLVGFTF